MKGSTTNELQKNSEAWPRAVPGRISSTIPSSWPYASGSSHPSLPRSRLFRSSIIARSSLPSSVSSCLCDDAVRHSRHTPVLIFLLHGGVSEGLRYRPVSRRCPRRLPLHSLHCLPLFPCRFSLNLTTVSILSSNAWTFSPSRETQKWSDRHLQFNSCFSRHFACRCERNSSQVRGTVSMGTDRAQVYCAFPS